MENKEFKKLTGEVKTKSNLVKIMPLKNFVIKMNAFYYELIEGESIEVDKMFLQNLKTEKVIKE